MLWYKGGVETSQCHKVALKGGRETLVCLGGYGGQGYVTYALYMEDLLDPRPVLMASEDAHFFQVLDNTLTCGSNMNDDSKPNPLLFTSIDKIQFQARDGNPSSLMTLTIRQGWRQVTAAEVKVCETGSPGPAEVNQDFLPSTKTYRITFILNGHGAYELAPESATAAHTLQLDLN
jgi:hypothetical protein